ncbi:MAG TPA: MmcQ/YjbR family DNA-binding protein [Polyangiaceae bacterium]|nr:MmcQ/YjbR family DNA-binding protein [Polyangiaceae bacterium]
MVSSKDAGGSALERLRQFGLRYPGAHTKSPWPGHLDLAVNDKTFAYLSIAGEPLKISCKLPRTADAALELPFTTPTAYGLGKSGWVTATFPDDETGVPVDLLEEWIDESYRAQAPKRLSAGLPPFGAAGLAPTNGESPAQRSTVKRKAAATPAAKPAAGSKRRSAKTSAKPAATARAAKPAARRAAKRKPASAAERSSARPKRDGVSQRTSKRPVKKRAR